MSELLRGTSVERAPGRKKGSINIDPLGRAALNPKSLRKAINAMCFDCQGGNADPGVTQRIRTCEIPTCPLHPVRPYQP